MYYVLILVASLLFSSQFMFTEGCQRENGSGWGVTLKLSFYGAIIAIPIILAMNKFSFSFSWFSFAVAFVYAVVCLILSYCTIKTFEYAKLAVYTVFSMIGGMALPFVYGIIRGESVGFMKIICFCLIVLSILLMHDGGEGSKKAFPYCIAVFVLNSLVGVISTYHQSCTEYCVDSGSYMVMTKVITILLCALAMLKTKDIWVNFKTIAYSIGSAGFNSIGNLFLLMALLHLPASVQYPMVTGGTIVFSTIIDLIRKVKVTKKELLATTIAFVASCLMAI